LVWASGAAYLWRSALFPKQHEPIKQTDRAIRLVGAVLLSSVFIYFVGFGLGLYGSSN
jgi:hypothetical protein